jgi:hypothetical protein
MKEYDRKKFVEKARSLESERLSKQEEWNQKNEAWIKEHGPIPFQVEKLVFEGE